MGKGKGSHFKWICPIKIGQIFVEFKFKKIKNLNSIIKLLKFIRKCKKRLPFKCKLINRFNKNFSNNLEKKYNCLLKL